MKRKTPKPVIKRAHRIAKAIAREHRKGARSAYATGMAAPQRGAPKRKR